MMKPVYTIKKMHEDPSDISSVELWKSVEQLIIKDYKWMENDYKPEVIIKALYSKNYFYLNYLVYEEKVTVSYTQINDPVFKDSCVEFFINLFPVETQAYFNIEFNAIGVIKMGYGIKRKRTYLTEADLSSIKIITSIKEPMKGSHGSDSWSLICAIPIHLFEKFSGRIFLEEDAIGNFYKCGDETECRHYGMWSEVINSSPDFHLPEYFGTIRFSK